MGNKWIVTGAILMFFAVALGAIGAHGLRDKITELQLESYKTGVLYNIVHALALIFVGVISAQKGRDFKIPGYLFSVGILLFSGSIYILSTRDITGLNWTFLGPVTPMGGTILMTGWVALAFSVLKNRN